MAAGYRLVIIRVREQSVDGLRRAAVTLERLMGIPERDAFIGLDRLPYPARGSLKLADAQLYIKALRTVGIVAQLEADGTEAGQALPPAAPPAVPRAPAAPRPAPAAPHPPRAAPQPPPRAAPQAPAAPLEPRAAPSPQRAPSPPSRAAAPPPRERVPPPLDLSEPPDGSVTRPYPVALAEELVVRSSSETPVHLPAAQPPAAPPRPAVTEVRPTMSASFVIDLGEAAAPSDDLPSLDLGGLPSLGEGGRPPLDDGGLPPLDVGELPSLDLGGPQEPGPAWAAHDLALDEPIALAPPPPPPRAPAPLDAGPPTDIGLDLALLDEGAEVFEDLAQQAQSAPLEVPPLSLDDFDPLK